MAFLWILMLVLPSCTCASRDTLESDSLEQQSLSLLAHVGKQQRRALHVIHAQLDRTRLSKSDREIVQAELDQMDHELGVQEHVEFKQLVQEQAALKKEAKLKSEADKNELENEDEENGEDHDTSRDHEGALSSAWAPLLGDLQSKCSGDDAELADDTTLLAQLRRCLRARRILADERASILQRRQSSQHAYMNDAKETMHAIHKLHISGKQRKAFDRDAVTATEVLLLKMRSVKKDLENLKRPL